MTEKGDLLSPSTTIAFFEDKEVKKERHDEKRYFSIVDIVSILTGSSQPSRYRTELKQQLIKIEGYTDLFGKIEKLKFLGIDGKRYPGDACDTETMSIVGIVPRHCL